MRRTETITMTAEETAIYHDGDDMAQYELSCALRLRGRDIIRAGRDDGVSTVVEICTSDGMMVDVVQ